MSQTPMQIRRQVLEEAGHRCAVPRCWQTPVDVHHIRTRGQGGEDTFENLIALCPNCHARYHRTKEIDTISMQHYKANLSVLNGRYGDLERRLMLYFAEEPNNGTVTLPGSLDILLMYLVQDGLLLRLGEPQGVSLRMLGQPQFLVYQLTPEGRSFIETWLEGASLE